MNPHTSMSSKRAKTFRVVLERAGTGPNWVVARVPADLKKLWPEWTSRRVLGSINGFAFQTTLLSGGKDKGYTMVVYKKIQTAARVGVGDKVELTLEPNLAEQVYEEPKELTAALREDRQLRRWFDKLTPSTRRYIAFYVSEAKNAETRTRRAEKIAERVMLTMEGELEVPPILRARFQVYPLAEQGWKAMTPTQRRNHLLGIFYPGTVEGQRRRVDRTIEDCVRVAQRKAGNSCE